MKLSPELIAKLDQYAESPELCAHRVFKALKENHPDLTNYDLMCFAIETLNAAVITGELKFAEGSIRMTAKDFYFAHYLRVSESLTSEAVSMPQESITKPGIIPDFSNGLRLMP